METVGEHEYSKKDLIGHGAFAVVFKGRNKKKPEQPVAIKCITKKNLAKSQNLLSKEIKILKELSDLHHENVVALLDCKETTHHVFLVMEFCNGGDLADYLHAKGTLSEDTIALFLRHIAGAMKALHTKGIVHRDLKPQNLLLCHSGKPNPLPHEITIKIADFGFARFLQDGVMAATLCGSPMYMAPEVIMSHQYDAKADLWSIGTIVFQCLTGKAPFQAQTPQQLKQFYERHANLAPNIPSGTSSELKDLLLRILKRSPRDRIEYSDFFVHPFLAQSAKSKTTPVPVPSRRRASSSSASDSPGMKAVSASPLSGIMPCSPPSPALHRLRQKENEGSPQELGGFIKVAKEECQSVSPVEDFVMVPENVDTSEHSGGSVKSGSSTKSRGSLDLASVTDQRLGCSPKSVRIPFSTCTQQMSPSRPSSLPVSSPAASPTSKPIPVPSQVQAYERMRKFSPCSPSRPKIEEYDSSPKVPRSNGMAIPPREKKNSVGSAPDIGSMSPPSVQFTIGTPPGSAWRRNSVSGVPTTGPLTPPRTGFNLQGASGSPHRRSDTEMQVIPGLARKRSNTEPCELFQKFGPSPPSLGDKEHLLKVAFGTSAPKGQVMPFSSAASNRDAPTRRRSIGATETSPPYTKNMDGPLFFVAPELAEETLMDKEHNDTMSKLNFVLALVESIIELAKSRGNPIIESVSPTMPNNDTFVLDHISFANEGQRKLEMLVLYIRALQMLSSSLNLARTEIKDGRLQPSNAVKNILVEMNQTYRECLNVCKELHRKGVPTQAGMNLNNVSVTAEKLIYSYAINMCQTAALDEIFGNPQECFKKYQSAQILLHSLAQQAQNTRDRQLLEKYKQSVEKRLFNLQTQAGYIFSYESS